MKHLFTVIGITLFLCGNAQTPTRTEFDALKARVTALEAKVPSWSKVNTFDSMFTIIPVTGGNIVNLNIAKIRQYISDSILPVRLKLNTTTSGLLGYQQSTNQNFLAKQSQIDVINLRIDNIKPDTVLKRTVDNLVIDFGQHEGMIDSLSMDNEATKQYLLKLKGLLLSIKLPE